MKKTLILGAIIALTTSCAFASETTATAPVNGPKSPCECQMSPKIHRMAKQKMDERKSEFENYLNLTEEQKTKAKSMKEANQKEMEPIIIQLKTKKEQKREIIKKIEATNPELIKLNKEIGCLQKQRRSLHEKNMNDFESILTKEQKIKLTKMKEDARKHFEKRNMEHLQKCPKVTFEDKV